MRVYKRVIRPKLTYGLASAQLNLAHINRLETFHLEGLKKVLRIATTFGQQTQTKQRTNTNQFLYDQATNG